MHLSGNTVVCGIFAHPIGHTMSPYMQTLAMEKMGFDGVYVPFHVLPERLEDAVRGLVSMSVRGVNITVPHKQAVIPLLDTVSEAARVVGAVNTVVNNDGKLYGDNTDVPGFMEGLLAAGDIEKLPGRICVLGAGGAARSITYACGARPEVKRIDIINRTAHKAEELAEEFSQITGKEVNGHGAADAVFERIVPKSGLIVNTTTLGIHHGDPSPIPLPELYHSGQIVNEINAVPFESKLITDARGHGAKTVSGLPMLAYQGARSLSMWAEREAPADYMLQVVREQMAARAKGG